MVKILIKLKRFKASDEENHEARKAFQSVLVVKAGSSNNFTKNYSKFSNRNVFKKYRSK